MARLKRSVIIAAALVGLLLVMLAVVLYLPTRSALERMEAFQFRRLVVARLDNEDAYRFFFVTNRQLDPGEAGIEERFSNERADTLTFGALDTHIEQALGIGMLLNPTEWLQNEEIRLDRVEPLAQADFVAQLRDQVARSPQRSLLVTVQGFREGFPSALRKTAFLGHVLDIDTPGLLFDWPGDQGSSPFGYRRARRLATASGEDLARLLELVIRDIRPERLWLMANSMGGQVVVDAFAVLYENADLADPQVEIDEVVLTAPDVNHAQFNEEFKHQITALARHVTVYASSNDRALVMSRILNRAKRLGESTFGEPDLDQFAEAASVADLVEPHSDLVTLVDVTPVNRTRNFHNFSLETPEFFDDLYLRLVNDDMPSSRLQYPVRAANGSVYWVLTGGR